MNKISVIVNTWNEEQNIKRCLDSVKWADEIVVVDMFSTDKTVAIAKKSAAKIFSHKYTSYVEPARNFAIKKTTGDWILILDADEEISSELAQKLKNLTENKEGLTYFRLPRKNIIFGKWIKHSRWWPDYNIRFFKKGAVCWSEKIHSVPLTRGEGFDLESKEANAILHYHYQTVSQHLERLNRYSDIQARELVENGYKFNWSDLLRKPMSEFLSRFFAGDGYKDGTHGLILSLLQSFSELVKYLKVWEKEGFKFQELPLDNFAMEMKKLGKELSYWWTTIFINETGNLFKKIPLKIKRRLTK
ncbi:MAG: glycosyltransferase family 2 protein [Candidatus Shapirobacteria bacterium]|nr:glycosyltransferase family 2 protein [Candidatus Shapirobacteria bacterium]